MRLFPLVLAVLAGCASGDPPVAPPATPPAADAPPAPESPENSALGSGWAAPPPDSIWVGDPPTLVPGPYRSLPDGWTSGVVRADEPMADVATVTGVRFARHDGFDRVVFDLDGPVPGVHVEYVDRPVRACGSGDAVPLEGDGWLRIELVPARAHTEAGEATLTTRRWTPGLPSIREAAVVCDFEVVMAVVLGVASPEAFRVHALRAPDRLVVDVRHAR